jgi:hypothetical protein
MDLSVEAIALDPRWAGLFIRDELDRAARRLCDHDFRWDLTSAVYDATTDDPLPAAIRSPEKPAAVWTLGGRPWALEVSDLYFDHFDEPACDIFAHYAAAEPIHLDAFVRKHVNQCSRCQGAYPELAAAYREIDQHAGSALLGLLIVFLTCLRPDLNYFIYVDPSPDMPPDPSDIDIELELDRVSGLCQWRAFRAGLLLGQFMEAYAASFGGESDLWVAWRTGEAIGPICDFVRAIPRVPYTYALAARNLALTRVCPGREESLLWLPSSGDIQPVPGLIQVENASIYEWEEIPGQAPCDLNLSALLRLAEQAAKAQMQELEPVIWRGHAAPAEPLERGNGIEQVLREIQDIKANQDAQIDRLERIGAYMKSSDKHTCEAELAELFPSIWRLLRHEVRCQLIGAEQTRRTPGGHATPQMVVHGVATAFELQLKHTVLETLLAHLKREDVREIPTGADHRHAVFMKHWKADRYNLGCIRLLLESAHPAILQCFDRYHWDRDDILAALDAVTEPRNAATHGQGMSPSAADEIRSDWLHWRGRSGGLFSVLFRSD